LSKPINETGAPRPGPAPGDDPLDPNVALFTAGLGMLAFQLVTRGKESVWA